VESPISLGLLLVLVPIPKVLIPHQAISACLAILVQAMMTISCPVMSPEIPVQIELNVGPNVDRPTELNHLTKLLTKAGFRVVESGGKATFVANMREPKKYDQVDLKDLTDEAFKPTRDLILKQGDAIVWRATKDIFGFEKGNVWSGYVVPSVIRIPKQPAPCFILTGTGERGRAAAFKRDYSEGIRSRVSIR